MLAHAEEAADAHNNSVHLAGRVDNYVVDVADLIILLVIDVYADEL